MPRFTVMVYPVWPGPIYCGEAYHAVPCDTKTKEESKNATTRP